MEESTHHINKNPFGNSNFVSKWMFIWIYRTLERGYSRDLKVTDMFNVVEEDKSANLHRKLQKNWSEEVKNRNKNASLFRTVVSTHLKEFALYTFILLLLLFLRISLPLQLVHLLSFLAARERASPSDVVGLWNAYFLAASVSLTTFVLAVVDNPLSFCIDRIGMRIRISLCSMIYKKALRLNRLTSADDANVGHIVNLMSNDVNLFNYVITYMPLLFIGPICLVTIFCILYQYIGWSTAVGYGVITFSIPVQALMGRSVSTFRLKIASYTDKRVNYMNDIIAGMRVIKIYCREKFFLDIINKIRRSECNILLKYSIFETIALHVPTLCNVQFAMCATLAAFLINKGETNHHVMFILFGMYRILRFDVIVMFPKAMFSLIEVHTSLQRIQNFLELDEKPKTNKIKNENKEYDIIIKDTSTTWKQNEQVPKLENLNLQIKKGELIGVIGSVGSGKTSLLMAILGELPLTTGSIVDLMTDSISYSPQEPWIFSASLRQNITFGLPMDEDRYANTIEAVSLNKDLSNLPNKDSTMVGDRGMSLSGGQKARIGLARAVYTDADIVLMDDPLSAVDVTVARHLFDRCIQGILKLKTRILVTHQIQYLKEMDRIIILDEGQIIYFDTHENLVHSGIDLSKFIFKEKDNETMNSEDAFSKNVFSEEYEKEKVDQTKMFDQQLKAKENLEVTKYGQLTMKTYTSYICNGSGTITLVLAFILEILLFTMLFYSDFYLMNWTENHYETRSTDVNAHIARISTNRSTSVANNLYSIGGIEVEPYWVFIMNYMSIIVIIMVIGTFSQITLNYTLLQAATKRHNKLITTLMKTMITFFDCNPIGRILNIFSKDIGQLDDQLPNKFTSFYSNVIQVLCAIVVSCAINPTSIFVLIPLFIIFIWIRRYYLCSSRDIQKLEAATRSPVFTYVSSSMTGLTTIRSFDRQRICEREFDSYQDYHTESSFMLLSATRWVAIRLDLLSTIFITVVCFSSVLYTSSSSSGLVGLSLFYAIDLLGNLQWTIRESVDVENLMTSVERTEEYANLPCEGSHNNIIDDELDENWPSKGEIRARDVSMKYAEDLPFALNKLNFQIKSNEKIGIVGRTGSGKSSLLTAIFRLVEYDGHIDIDGVDIKTLGLHRLRSKISIIPQDPVLFIGTLRDNLDPLHEFDDYYLSNSLKKVHLHFDKGLHTTVSNGGSNFSVGQKQLICLARALLRKNSILFIDEATANIDNYTDGLIQETIKDHFSGCTVLTIAHRLQTIIDSDKIMVMDNGQLVEFDTPKQMINNEKGYFHKLIINSWNGDQLKTMINKKNN